PALFPPDPPPPTSPLFPYTTLFRSSEGPPAAQQAQFLCHARQRPVPEDNATVQRRVFERVHTVLALTPSSRTPWAAGGTRCDVLDRKSTRLNSSHVAISYAVFCWKK